MNSPDLWVAFQPAAAFRHLAQDERRGGRWLALRRPLYLVLLLAAFGSLATSGRVSLRLLIGCAECAAFVPVLAIATLALIRGRRSRLPFSRAIDLFLMGHLPWSLWVIAAAAEWAFVPTVTAYDWLKYRWVWELAAGVAFVWSCLIDFWFLRCVFQKTPFQAVRDLLLQRSIAWTAALAIFVGSGGWQVVATRLGL